MIRSLSFPACGYSCIPPNTPEGNLDTRGGVRLFCIWAWSGSVSMPTCYVNWRNSRCIASGCGGRSSSLPHILHMVCSFILHNERPREYQDTRKRNDLEGMHKDGTVFYKCPAENPLSKPQDCQRNDPDEKTCRHDLTLHPCLPDKSLHRTGTPQRQEIYSDTPLCR